MKESDQPDGIANLVTNPEYITTAVNIGGYVLNLPVKNPNYVRPNGDDTNEDLTVID